MSRLTDIVSQVVASAQDAEGSIDSHAAVTMGVPLVKADDEAVDQCISEALAKRIKDAATRVSKAANDAPDSQSDLFELRPRHALDIEGRTLKSTRALSRLEFERIRQIRRESLANDAAYLARLDNAASTLAPIWDAQPALTYGEACDLLRQSRAA